MHRLLWNWKMKRNMKTNLGGKLSLSVELEANTQVEVKVEKC